MALFDFTSNFLTNTFVFQVFIPFLILFAILWGLLEAINVFGSSRVKLVIALGFTLIASFTNSWILAYIATLGAYMAVVLFGVLFLFGILRWGLGRGHDIYLETSSYEKQYKHYARQLRDIEDKVRSGGLSESEMHSEIKKAKDIKEKMEILRLKMTQT
jgi:uncharacterized membrane protein